MAFDVSSAVVAAGFAAGFAVVSNMAGSGCGQAGFF
jgi:hypothetical protein